MVFQCVGMKYVIHQVVGVTELQVVFGNVTTEVGLGAALRCVIAPLLLMEAIHEFMESTALILIGLILLHKRRFEAT